VIYPADSRPILEDDVILEPAVHPLDQPARIREKVGGCHRKFKELGIIRYQVPEKRGDPSEPAFQKET